MVKGEGEGGTLLLALLLPLFMKEGNSRVRQGRPVKVVWVRAIGGKGYSGTRIRPARRAKKEWNAEKQFRVLSFAFDKVGWARVTGMIESLE